MRDIEAIERKYMKDDITDFRPGDTVRVEMKIVDSGRARTQSFQGIVIRRRGGGLRETITVRKVSFGVGVERTFPVHSPLISEIEVISRGDVRRARLYYLRDKVGRGARVKEKRYI